MIFVRKYINYVMQGFDLNWKFQDISKTEEENTFHLEPNSMGKECENSLYFTTYWLQIEKIE